MNDIPANFAMFLLRTDLADLQIKSTHNSQALLFVLGTGILVVILIIYNILRKKR